MQGVLTTGSLADVTACHSKLSSYATALQGELAARRAAVAALSAELAKQVRAIASNCLVSCTNTAKAISPEALVQAAGGLDGAVA